MIFSYINLQNIIKKISIIFHIEKVCFLIGNTFNYFCRTMYISYIYTAHRRNIHSTGGAPEPIDTTQINL